MNRTLRLLIGALAISVLLNVFALGFLIGRTRFAHPPAPPPRPGESIRLDLRAIGEVLPKGERRELHHALAEQRGELQRRLAALRAAQNEVDAALTAEPFDPARLEAAYARLREASATILEPVQRTMVVFAGRLDSEQRRALAEHLSQMRHRMQEMKQRRQEGMRQRIAVLKEHARELVHRRQELDARLKTAGRNAGARSLREALNRIEREEERLGARIDEIARRIRQTTRENTRRVEIEIHRPAGPQQPPEPPPDAP